ncbi:MAG: biopolymer transporter ExbD [Chromatiales bacterium]|nr:biopolymer transporter ExbD [Chromatiales bacterium]
MNLRPYRRREEVDLNLTPLIDVVFLLLLFFMLSTTFQQEVRLKVELPEASAERPDEQQIIDAGISAEGEYFINGDRVVDTNIKTLRQALRTVHEANPELPVVINADARTPHQAVIRFLDAAQQAGITRLRFAAERPEGDG